MDYDIRRLVGYVEYEKVGQAITRWPFDFSVENDTDPRIVGFLEWVRERYAEEIAAHTPTLNDIILADKGGDSIA